MDVRRIQLKLLCNIIFIVILGLLLHFVSKADTTDSTTYGSGGYGYCDYGSCSITLSSTGAVSLNVTPTGGGSCTVASDSVSVLTDNTLGYTLQLNTSTTSTTMTNGGNTISATSGTYASPTVLAANAWGYRIDNLASFGAGPTLAMSNQSPGAQTYAGVPASNQTPATIASTSTPANPAITTTVWYGVCANTSVANGAYSAQVTYTATTN